MPTHKERRRTGAASGVAGIRRYQVDLIVTMDSRTASGANVETYLAGVGFDYGDPHSVNLLAVVVRQDIEKLGDAAFDWQCVITYETPDVRVPQGGDPLLRDPVIRWGSSLELRDLINDYSSPSVPIRNSAGFPFQNQPQRYFAVMNLQYTRNESDIPFNFFSQDTQEKNVALVNNAPFIVDGRTIQTGRALLYLEDAEKIKEGAVTYYRITYRFLFVFNQDGWDNFYALDFGFVDTNGLIVDSKNEPVSEPWPLNGAGVKRAASTDAPALKLFKMYKTVSFAPLNFS